MIRRRLSVEQFQKIVPVLFKIFLIGMVRQFLAHTFFNYGLHLPKYLSAIWVWKELLIVLVAGWLLWLFIVNLDVREKILGNKWLKRITIGCISSLIISLSTTLFIHHQHIISFISSAKFNYTPLIIFVVSFAASLVLSSESQQDLIKTIITTIKRVVIFSLFRYIILNTIPNALDRIGYAQPGTSIERTVDNPPPSLWLTEFYTGYIRNQGPFSGPLSLGFYLGVMWPFFYGGVLYKKRFSDTRGRRFLYLFMVISTYSRAARAMFLLVSFLMALIVYRKYIAYLISGGIMFGLLILVYILGGGGGEVVFRTRSDQGHIQFFLEGLRLVKQHRLRGIGAAVVGPGANYGGIANEVFNPENQYMQIWLEYGLAGVIFWLLNYLLIFSKPIQYRWQTLKGKYSSLLHKEGVMFSGIGLALIALAGAGMVLHPFVDSSSMYPFMLSCGIIFATFGRTNHIFQTPSGHVKSSLKESKAEKDHTQQTKNSFSKKMFGSSQIFRLLVIRTVGVSVFFIVQNYLVYGIGVIHSTVSISFLRDSIFGATLLTSILRHRSKILLFLKSYWPAVAPILLIICINIINVFFQLDNSLSLIAGIKYDIAQFIIIGAGLWRGYLLARQHRGKLLFHYIDRFLKFALVLIFVGVLRQLLKDIFPHVFIQYLGYSSPSDFIPYTRPPIYYITGSGGLERLSGFFVGPNTLGFFLIALTSVVYMRLHKVLSQYQLILLSSAYLIVSILTLSRAAVIGVGIQLIILIIATHYSGFTIRRHQVKKIPKRSYYYIGVVVVMTISCLAIINMRKESSNTERGSATSITQELLSQKVSLLGYGPGYVGPAQHYEEDYLSHQKNDFALVENIYLQILINQGIIGFILFCWIFIGLFYFHYQLQSSFAHQKDNIFGLITQYMGVGLAGLLLVGGFLHVFIDSMVNYLILVPYSTALAYQYRNTLSFSKESKGIEATSIRV